MAYTKQTWENLPSQTTPINADRLTHIEDGIFNAAATADTAASNASSAISGLAGKVDKVEGKGLSTNDFTDTLKTKLDNIETGAEVNVQSDWNEADSSSDAFILNKPTLGTASAKDSTSVVTDSTDLVESGAVYTALQGKTDNSVIAPTENGTTVQKSGGYAVGSHAIRNGAFITWKNAKAQGETINDASDYTSGDVADWLTHFSTFALSNVFSAYAKVADIGLAKYGNVVQIRLSTTNNSIEPNVWNVIGTLKDEYKPLIACYETALNANGEPVGWVRIKETGDIDIYHTGSANIKCALGATYITAK